MMIRHEPDRIEHIGDALIQHGPLNDRVYIMKIGSSDPKKLIEKVEVLAVDEGYSKVFAKVPATLARLFIDAGYEKEACVSGYFRGRESALFLGKYLQKFRKKEDCRDELDRIADLAIKRYHAGNPVCQTGLPFRIRPCNRTDAPLMSRLYARVFQSYPFPIDYPEYLIQTMENDVDYFGVEVHGNLVALSSAEMDRNEENVEMTDFATLPEWEGNGLAFNLLLAMEKEVRAKGIRTAYTIARAASVGMNITFARGGYCFGGRLINNTNISGHIESMNVWFKSL
ncbi:MAG: putative beta-lysine N-acetyltransferase [Syntrophales bacterium]|jgi:putative beta-lysine N-acetyltransferase|nr:putative beta-lysine N-acetyltransferase [Syntrophales bacterium]